MTYQQALVGHLRTTLPVAAMDDVAMEAMDDVAMDRWMDGEPLTFMLRYMSLGHDDALPARFGGPSQDDTASGRMWSQRWMT